MTNLGPEQGDRVGQHRGQDPTPVKEDEDAGEHDPALDREEQDQSPDTGERALGPVLDRGTTTLGPEQGDRAELDQSPGPDREETVTGAEQADKVKQDQGPNPET